MNALHVLVISVGAILGWEMSRRWLEPRSLRLMRVALWQRQWRLFWIFFWKPDEIESARIVASEEDESGL